MDKTTAFVEMLLTLFLIITAFVMYQFAKRIPGWIYRQVAKRVSADQKMETRVARALEGLDENDKLSMFLQEMTERILPLLGSQEERLRKKLARATQANKDDELIISLNLALQETEDVRRGYEDLAKDLSKSVRKALSDQRCRDELEKQFINLKGSFEASRKNGDTVLHTLIKRSTPHSASAPT